MKHFKTLKKVKESGITYTILQDASTGVIVAARRVNLGIYSKVMAWAVYGLNEDCSRPEFFSTIKALNEGRPLQLSWL